MTDANEHGQFPLRDFLGMELTGDEPGGGTATIDITEKHHNPNGVVHGAVLFAMVDTAMGKATMSVLDENFFCATIEVSLRFIRPVGNGTVVAEATVLKRGRHVVHLDARIHDAEGRLIATSDGTFAIIDGAPR
ncbi:MAG: PaaI family thioesterase [Actinobacteria bacterium]|nr:MAG: PaaI family thioesterase [Actinomycetota bacterium]